MQVVFRSLGKVVDFLQLRLLFVGDIHRKTERNELANIQMSAKHEIHREKSIRPKASGHRPFVSNCTKKMCFSFSVTTLIDI